MRNDTNKATQKDVELLIVEAFQSASRTLDVLERLTVTVWRHSLPRRGEEDLTPKTSVAPREASEKDGTLVCSIKETCTKTGLSRTRIYQAIGSGELAAVKCGHRTLIEMEELRRWIASLPRVRRN